MKKALVQTNLFHSYVPDMMSSCQEALDQPQPEQPSGLPLVLVAAALLIDPDGRILVAQRPDDKHMGGLWEFPGGKVNEGEFPEFALMRELKEELGIETRPGCFFPVSFASHSYDNFKLLMPLYGCRAWRNPPRALEHKAVKWIRPHQLYDMDMPPADGPLNDSVIRFLEPG